MSLVLLKQHSPKIIDGKAIAQSVLDEVKSDVERYTAQGVEPCLAVVFGWRRSCKSGVCT